MPAAQRRVFVVGGSFAGLCIGRDLKKDFLVTIVDAKEYFEYTPGVLRAYVKPKHLDALTFTLYPVIEYQMGLKYIWGEVLEMKPDKTARIKPIFTSAEETIDFDYSIIAAGCNFGPFHKWGESLWFPVIHEAARKESTWGDIDERFLEGRRRHILQEYKSIRDLNTAKGSVMVVGAGFIGVEWVTELQHFFPNLSLAICDMLPRCLGPLPDNAAAYCSNYMKKAGITEVYGKPFNEKDEGYILETKLKDSNGKPGWDKKYVCIGVKASNYFVPDEVKSEAKSFMANAFILVDQTLAVKTKENKRWCVDEKGYGRIYAVGDCNFGCVQIPKDDPDLLRQAEGAVQLHSYKCTFDYKGETCPFKDGEKVKIKSFRAGIINLGKSEGGHVYATLAQAPKADVDGKGSVTIHTDKATIHFDQSECPFKKFDEVEFVEFTPEITGLGKSSAEISGKHTVTATLKTQAKISIKKVGRTLEAWPVPPIPKISYPGEEEAVVACTNIHRIDKLLYHSKTVDCCYAPLEPANFHWPWGAGMFATSLGPDTACFVAGANWQRNSGLMCVWGSPCAVQKEIIEASKTDECANGVIGRIIWHFVHHTPVHLWGGGPRWGY